MNNTSVVLNVPGAVSTDTITGFDSSKTISGCWCRFVVMTFELGSVTGVFESTAKQLTVAIT
jgi:hypothetical protein